MDHYSFVKGSENMKILMKLYGFFIQITRMQGFVGRILLGDQIEKGVFLKKSTATLSDVHGNLTDM